MKTPNKNQMTILAMTALMLGSSPGLAAEQKAQTGGAIYLSAGDVGPKGRVILAFKEGRKITFRVCADHTVLGENTEEAKKNCVTKAGTKDIVLLEKELSTELPKVLAKILKTTDPESEKLIREMFNAQDPNMAPPGSKLAGLYDKQTASNKELDQIKAFIKKYGEKNADLARKTALEKELTDLSKEIAGLEKDRESLKKEVAHLKDLMKQIQDEKVLTTDIDSAQNEQCESVELSDVLDHLADQKFDGTGVIWDDIAKDKNGKILYMNHADAVKYCEKEGKRLPTAREQALLSQSMGAKGLKETAHPDVKTSDARVSAEIFQMNKDGYYAIYKKNSAGETVVNFYFNNTGYQKPAGDLGANYFWSSSVRPDYAYDAYVLGGQDGDVDYGVRDNNFAVRCVASR